MSTAEPHHQLTKIHRLENWRFANEAARLALTGATSGDVGKVAYQIDTQSYWRLDDYSPLTWVLVSGGTAGTPGSVWRDGSGAPSDSLGVNGDYYLDTPIGDVYKKATGAYSVVGNIKGAAGDNGANGSVWRDGSGVPSNSLGVDGDYYLNDATGDVYARAGGTYSIVANIKGADGGDGAPGDDGLPGVDGSVWRDGTGVPSNALGVNGDYYLDTATGDVYKKSAGTYAVVGNVKGATGATGAGAVVLHGIGNPGSGLGSDGQLYINEQQGDIWLKIAGAWTLYGANAYYWQGKALDPSMVSPTNGDIPTYDSTLNSGAGGWKAAAPVVSSFSGMDDETRARLNLAIL